MRIACAYTDASTDIPSTPDCGGHGEDGSENTRLAYLEAGIESLYDAARETVDEWEEFDIVDAHQLVALERLLHHLDIIANYTLKEQA